MKKIILLSVIFLTMLLAGCIFNKETSICNNIKGDNHKVLSCYIKLGIEKGNASVCDDIGWFKSLFDQTDLKDNCYLSLGEILQDLSTCDKIRNLGWKRLCYLDIAETKEDPEICNKILEISQPKNSNLKNYLNESKDYCLVNVAKIKQDTNICEKIIEAKYKSMCYQNVN
jgi:hypothetical protein